LWLRRHNSMTNSGWLKRVRWGARLLFWSAAGYWGLDILNPWELDVISGAPMLFATLYSVRALQPLFLAPMLVGTFLLVQPVPGRGRDSTDLLRSRLMAVAVACALVLLALEIDGVVSQTHTLQRFLGWGQVLAECLFVVTVMLYVGNLAARFERRDIARIAAVTAYAQLILGLTLFVIGALPFSVSRWFGPASMSQLAHLRLYLLVRLVVRLAVWLPTLGALWKFGSVIRLVPKGKCLCCGYPTRDLVSNRCPECGAERA
jgi:hypothetical protein